MKLFSRLGKRNERGAALMMIALSMTSVLAVTGVVIDGSRAFAERRQMQNAADSAALAGARALDRVTAGAEVGIWNAVVGSATANGADAASITCRLVTELLADLGTCPTANTGTAVAIRNAASGVRVGVAATKTTSFIRVVGVDTFRAGASATGQIQALASGRSPFALCAVGSSDPRSLGDGQTLAKTILLPDNTINPLAVDPTPSNWNDDSARTVDLQSPQPARCGQGTEFKGLSEDLQPVPVPGEADLYNGTHGINVGSSVIAGNRACRGTLTQGCIILVPLCHAVQIAEGPPAVYGKHDRLWCVRFAAFRINDLSSSSRIGGVLVDEGLVVGGQGGGHAIVGEARLIKLSE